MEEVVNLIVHWPDNPRFQQLLAAKAGEYSQRLALAGQLSRRVALDARYKEAVLARLLVAGMVETGEVAREFMATTGHHFDISIFNNAARVIHDLATTGGANCHKEIDTMQAWVQG